MACCTYYMDHEVAHHKAREDGTVKELLDDIEKLIGERWMVARYEFRSGIFWLKKREVYAVLTPTIDPEWQIINFPWEGKECSINQFVPRANLLAFLMGVRIGAQATTIEEQS